MLDARERRSWLGSLKLCHIALKARAPSSVQPVATDRRRAGTTIGVGPRSHVELREQRVDRPDEPGVAQQRAESTPGMPERPLEAELSVIIRPLARSGRVLASRAETLPPIELPTSTAPVGHRASMTCGAENPVRPAQATIRYSWRRPPRRSVLRSWPRSISPISAGGVSSAEGSRGSRERWGRCAL